MSRIPGWQGWEHEIQKLLGLDPTICSGNQWHDQGDGTDNRHDSPWPIMFDAKYTDTKRSWSLKASEVRQWFTTCEERGKRAIMAIRIWERGRPFPDDFVVCPANDYAELVEFYRAGHGTQPEFLVFPPGVRKVDFDGVTYTLHTEDPR